jgi:O-glycosyl hydrolase
MSTRPPFKNLFLSLLGILLMITLTACATPSTQPLPDEIRILPAEKRQTIEGFGASAAWWAQDVGGWEDPKRNQVIRLLFDGQDGIGLSILRYNIGAGAGDYIQDRWRRAQTFETAPGVYDWKRDANAVWVLKAAKTAGVEQFVAFSNSPPGRMTLSGVPVGQVDGTSNLRPEMVEAYAQYLVDIVRHLQEDEHIPIGWVSPVNEPQLDWKFGNGQEGCHYTPAEVQQVTRALLRAIEKNKLNVKVSAFESGEWKNAQAYFDALLADKETAPLLDHISVHSYWSETSDKRAALDYLRQKYPGTRLWMSEWTEMKSGVDTGMDSALVLARTLHEDLTLGEVTSWQYWIAVSKYSFRDGLLYVDTSSHAVTETKRLWAMGNYSRYIRPGALRIATKAGSDDLKVSAYQGADPKQLVMVVVNDGKQALKKTISGIPSAYTQVSLHETSAEKDLAEVYSGQPASAYTFPAESLTTLVFTQP